MAFVPLSREVSAVQPTLAGGRPCTEQERAMIMEQVMLSVRRLWFGARTVAGDLATRVVEPGGELVMCIDGEGAGVDELVREAYRRGSYVVNTTLTRPSDLGARLQRAGFRPVQAHGTFVLDEAAYRAEAANPSPVPPRRSLLRLFGRRPAETAVRVIDGPELPVWNDVCWQAFGVRSSVAASLAEKRQAFSAMGMAARWYLATVDGKPAGTAILFQDERAAQVLAVGTAPALRHRGVASALMHRLIGDWLAEGWGFLFLDTTPSSPAERLYRRLGFAPAYVREVYAPSRLSLLTDA